MSELLTPLEDLDQPQEPAPQYRGSVEPQQYAPQYQQQQPQQAHATASQTSSWQTFVQLVMAPAFLKAAAVAIAVVFFAIILPIDQYVMTHAKFLESVPNSAAIVKAVVAGLVITFIRPPTL